MADNESSGQAEMTNAELRKAYDAIKAERDQYRDANMQYAEREQAQGARDLFRSRGYADEHADLFLRTHEGEVTDAAIDQFVERYKLSPSVAGSANPTTGVQQNPAVNYPGANPMARVAAGGDGVAEPRKVNYKELIELIQKDEIGTINRLRAGDIKVLATDSAQVVANMPSRPQPIPVENTS